MNKKFEMRSLWPLLKRSFKGFSEDKVPRLSASLSYYTVFSLAPMLILVMYALGMFLGQEAVQNEIYRQLDNFIGSDAAKQLQEMIKSASNTGTGITAVVGVVTLLIGATGVFAEIQDSINTIWGLKPKPRAGIWKLLKNRLLSFGIIGSLGFLLLVSLSVTAVVEAIGGRLKETFPDAGVVVLYIINLVLTIVVTTALFAVIFKVLPDARIKWREVLPGAVATSILFLLGKFGISLYVGQSNIGSTFGAAGSLVVLLVWIYYSAMILYLGAEFTKSYIVEHGNGIRPNHYAEAVVEQTVKADEKGEPAVRPGRSDRRQEPPAAKSQLPRRRPAPESAPHGRSPKPAPSSIKPVHNGYSGNRLSGIPAIAVGILAFMVNAIRSNRR